MGYTAAWETVPHYGISYACHSKLFGSLFLLLSLKYSVKLPIEYHNGIINNFSYYGRVIASSENDAGEVD